MIFITPPEGISDPGPLHKVAFDLKLDIDIEVYTTEEITLSEACACAAFQNIKHPVIVLSGRAACAWAGLDTVKGAQIGYTYWYKEVRLVPTHLMTDILENSTKYIDLLETIRNCLVYPRECPTTVNILSDEPEIEFWMNSTKSMIRAAKKEQFTAEWLEKITDCVPKEIDLHLKVEPVIHYIRDENTVLIEYMVERILTADYVSFDLETNGFSPFTNGILCIAFATSENEAFIVTASALQSVKVCDLIRELFSMEDIRWVGHNAKFDCRFLLNHKRIKKCPVVSEDTMVLHYILDERLGTHDLKQLSRKRLGVPDYESFIHSLLPNKTTDSYQYIPRHILFKYAALDVCYTLALLKQMLQEVSQGNGGLTTIYRFLVEATNAFVEIENNGLLVDEDAVNVAQIDFEEAIAEKYEVITSIVGESFNPRSPKQVAIYLYDVCGLEEVRLFRNHKPRSTSHEALEKLAKLHPDNSFLTTLMDIRAMEKLSSTYVEPVMAKVNKNTGRLHTDFKLHGTVTGRLSSSKPNLQNVPRTTRNQWAKVIRSFFVASPGYLLINADYKGAELRVATCFAEEPVWRDAFLHDRDLHAEVCLRLYGPTFTKENRMIAKMLAFGLLYGRGASSIATERNMPLHEAEKLVKDYFLALPRIKEHLDWVKRETKEKGYLVTPIGRERRFGYITRSNFGRISSQAANFRISSMSTDNCLRAGIDFHNWCKKNPQYGARLLLLVHDNLIAEAPTEHAEYVTEILEIIMQEAPTKFGLTYVPFTTDSRTGLRWSDLT